MNLKQVSSAQIAALVQGDKVHKDLYLSEELFAIEQRELFGSTWSFLGHASQIAESGDFFTVDIAGQSLIVLRDDKGEIRALHNRCAHKGAQLLTTESGRLSGRFLRCPYHAWSYRLDGALAAYPLRSGYENTGLLACESGRGLSPVAALHVYRDFIFARLNAGGPTFHEYFGDVLPTIDLMVDRSPVGRLEIAGGVLRNVVHCNWKLYLENVNDSVHPVSTHESAVRAAQAVARDRGPEPMPLAFEQILPFGERYEFFEGMGGKVFPNGHSISGTRFSVHSGYGNLGEYVKDLQAAYGEERAKQVLEQAPQNTVLYPSLAIKGSPQTIRVIRPIAVDKTVIEAWNFRTVGGPDLLLDRALTYSRLVFSPMSVVAHDDLHLFESQQKGLRSGPNPWVSLHRDHAPDESDQQTVETSGTSELLMRNQYRAWAKFMTLNMKDA